MSVPMQVGKQGVLLSGRQSVDHSGQVEQVAGGSVGIGGGIEEGSEDGEGEEEGDDRGVGTPRRTLDEERGKGKG